MGWARSQGFWGGRGGGRTGASGGVVLESEEKVVGVGTNEGVSRVNGVSFEVVDERREGEGKFGVEGGRGGLCKHLCVFLQEKQ